MPIRPAASLLAALALSLAAGAASAQRVPAPPQACADFYGHVNAAWSAQHPLPPGREHFSRWDQLAELGQARRDELLAATRAPEGGLAARHLADLVASSLDEAVIESAGTRAIKLLLDRIARIRRNRDVPAAIADLHAAGVPVLFDFQVLRDAQGQPYAQIGPGGLGLPDAGFYASEDPGVRAVDLRYRTTVSEWLRLTGTPGRQLAPESSWIMAFEGELAKAALAGTPLQVMAAADAERATGTLGLTAFLERQGLKASQVALVSPAFFRAVDAQLVRARPEQWRSYLRAHIIRELAPVLPKAYREPWVQLYEVYLGGQAAPTPRALWLRQWLVAQAPELLDAAYDDRWLPDERRARAQAIADAVRASALAAVDRADWLSDAGKAKARERLQTLELEIGRQIPDETFKDLRTTRGDLAGSVLGLRKWLRAHALQRARRAWPAEQWQPLLALMPQENRLVATTAVLQPPVLGEAASAGDYGAFGALLAQQVAIGLQAWDGTDATAWTRRAQPLIAQYSAYSATGGATRVNGTRSHAQNQADLAGLELAWAALGTQGAPAPDAARAFFTAWAAMWARNDQAVPLARAQATSHYAPAKWRVNGPLVNLPVFAATYGCGARSAMVRPAGRQVALWR